MTALINARGTFTPLGVSRSSREVAQATAEALTEFQPMAALKVAVEKELAVFAGSEAATIVHCAAAAITLCVAAAITGTDTGAIAALPETGGRPNRILLPAGHQVNYGHPLTQAIRLAGGVPVALGTAEACTIADLAAELARAPAAALLLVSSRLTLEPGPDPAEAAALARSHGLPLILDAAAQDFRLKELSATGADAVIVSAQKYLAAPTAGLIVGSAGFIAAVAAQESGIGRGMKTTKEALAGVRAALHERSSLNLADWQRQQQEKLDLCRRLLEAACPPHALRCSIEPDPTGLPFSRLCLTLGPAAPALAEALRQGDPAVWVMDHRAAAGDLLLELVPLTMPEIARLADRVALLLPDATRA
jgi:L-seryl-tRNA(Ser) seleniumtransferase